MILQEGVSLHEIQTKKFKDIGISIRFRSNLEEKKAGIRSLLALMLCDRCSRYNTKKKMSDMQDQLYGATLHAQTAGYGASQIIDFRSKIVNPSYVKEGDDVIAQWLAFLHEIICAPLLEEDAFQEAKQMLLSKIERGLDDPGQYVISKGLKLAGSNTYLGVSALGEKESIQALTLQDVQTGYEEMIHQDEISIIICGDVQPKWLAGIKKIMQFQPRNIALDSYYVADNQIDELVTYEFKNISQSYLMMTWFTQTSAVDQEYYALRVLNAMLGQYSTSLLFQEVREKRSLCYSIYSNLISYDGALGITTGIEKENVDQTIRLIKEQFTRLAQGEFDDHLLEVSKTMIINSLRASKDSLVSLVALAYQNQLLEEQRCSEDIITLIESVKREDVCRVANKCSLKKVFVLTKEDAHEDNHK